MGQTETVKALIDAGADVNLKGKDDRTAMMAAVRKGHTEIVDVLKRAGARQ